MKKLFSALIAISVIAFSASTSYAQNEINMLFWQPGGQGSTEEAAPILNQLFSKLSAKTGITISGQYSNDLGEGLLLIKNKKINVAIVPVDILDNKRINTPYRIILSTQPLGTRKSFEQYSLYSNKQTAINQIKTLYTTTEFQGDYVKNNILGSIQDQLDKDLKIIPSTETFAQLKKISMQNIQTDEGVLLNSFETASLSKTKLDFIKNLIKLFTSPPTKPPQVVSFELSEGFENKIRNGLLELSKEPETKQIIEELRLEGFAETAQ